MAPVPARVNRGVIKYGLEGKALMPGLPSKSRDQYTLLDYGTARRTAKNLDNVFNLKKHGDKTLHKTLRNTMNNAHMMKSTDPSPGGSIRDHELESSKASSDQGSVKPSPRKPFVVTVGGERSRRCCQSEALLALPNASKGGGV